MSGSISACHSVPLQRADDDRASSRGTGGGALPILGSSSRNMPGIGSCAFAMTVAGIVNMPARTILLVALMPASTYVRRMETPPGTSLNLRFKARRMRHEDGFAMPRRLRVGDGAQ